MTIKVLEKVEGCMPEVVKVGDWIDLRTAEEVKLKAPYADTLHRYRKDKETKEEERLRIVNFDHKLIRLGVCIEMPKGCEGYLIVRSSTFKKYGIIQSNSKGIIDQSYCSDKDEWKLPVLATRAITIPAGTRIAQFRIQLSQKATIWQKIKWLFSNKIKVVRVNSLDNPERGGFGEGTK